MHELMYVVAVTLVDFYNTVDWSRASDFLSFVNESLTLLVALSGSQNDDKKDD